MADLGVLPNSVVRELSTVVFEMTNLVGSCRGNPLSTRSEVDVSVSCTSDDDDASGLGYAVSEWSLS